MGKKEMLVKQYVEDMGEHGVSATDITFDLSFARRINVYPILYRLEEMGLIVRQYVEVAENRFKGDALILWRKPKPSNQRKLFE